MSITVTQQHLDLIASIYDSAITAEEWPNILDRLAPEVGAKSSALLMLDLNERYRYSISATTSNLLPEMHTTYIDQYAKYEEEHFSRVATSPAGIIFNERERYGDKEEFDNRPDVAYLRSAAGILERFALKLNDDPSWFECITFQYHLGRGNINEVEEGYLRLFLPHLAKSTQLTRTFSLLRDRYSAVLGALDYVSIGLFVVDGSGRILVKNEVASVIVEKSSALHCSPSGCLTLKDKQKDVLLRKYLTELSNTANAQANHSAKSLVIGNSNDIEPIYLEVAPIRDTDKEIGYGAGGALVAVYDPEQHRDIDLDGVQEVFELTQSESSVLCHVLEGRGNQDIADIRGVNSETVKTQLKSLFKKTNAVNRTHLVKRILDYNLPLRK